MANQKLRGAEAALHETTILGDSSTGSLPYERGQDGDPRYHIQRLRAQLADMIGHLREDVENFDEPQLKAMFETSAEVLGGLAKALSDYEQKNEAAWR
ncbi:MAG TPA: hypothetical protein VMV26_00820 [Alphaproteobacteria bacterium]|nr:hypothetical protein [Alphaproteobacteria bacterium]